MTALEQMGAKAKEAARALGKAGAKKTAALELAAAALWDRREEILRANGEDVAAGEAAGMRPSLLDRLRLTEERIAAMAQAVREVAAAPDPVEAYRRCVREFVG